MMKDLYPLFGIVTVLNTPFTTTYKIDRKSLLRNVKNALSAGVSGFLVPAMAAEVYKLSVPERVEMIEIVLEEVNGRVPVIAGAGETDMEKGKSILKQYIAIGCSHVLFQIPYHHEEAFYNHFMCLADLNPEVIMLQDWDSGGYGLPDDLICRLFDEVAAFRCLKIETIPAGVKYSRIMDLTEGRLNISGGWAVMQMIEGLQRGVHAFMPTGMHYLYTRIYNDYISGKQAKAEQLFNEILPVLAFSNQHLDISIHFFKRLLHQSGVYETAMVRTPILEFDSFHELSANKLIERVIKLEDQIKREIS